MSGGLVLRGRGLLRAGGGLRRSMEVWRGVAHKRRNGAASRTMATNSASEQSPSYTATLSGQPDVRRIRFCLLMRTS